MHWMTIIKNVALAAAIIIVLNLFVGMGIKTLYPAPDFTTFCAEDLPAQGTQQACEEAGGKWIEQGEITYRDSIPIPGPRPLGVEAISYCDQYATCSKAFDTAHQ